jgi:hypothetical protein
MSHDALKEEDDELSFLYYYITLLLFYCPCHVATLAPCLPPLFWKFLFWACDPFTLKTFMISKQEQ